MVATAKLSLKSHHGTNSQLNSTQEASKNTRSPTIRPIPAGDLQDSPPKIHVKSVGSAVNLSMATSSPKFAAVSVQLANHLLLLATV